MLTQQIIKTIVKEEIRGELKPIRSDVSKIKLNITELKYEVTDIKTDVKGMKGEIVEIKGDMEEMKGEMGEIKGEISEMNGKIDKLTEIVIDFVGKSKNFEEETTVMAGQISRNIDRIEKLDLSEFGFVTVA